MLDHKRHHIIALVTLVAIVMMLAPEIPQVKASGGLLLDGTGTACATSVGSSVSIPSSTCSFSSGLCGNHQGGVCPAGDMVILQILLNNTGTVTSVLSTQGLDHWFRRASVLNGLGGKMEEWYSTTTRPVSNPSIYITENLSGITVAVQEFAIAGYDTIAPFDTNSATPANMTGKSSSMSAPISTNDGQDFILGFAYGGQGTFTPAAGFSGICVDASPCSFLGISPDASEYEIVTKVQTGSPISIVQTGGASWGFIADAVQSASPTAFSVSPSKGPVGTALAIRGAAFTNVVAVSFCGISPPSFKVVSDSLITTYAPQLVTPPSNQTCHITVSGSAGTSLAEAADLFSFLPNVTSVNPMSGSIGSNVTITGSSFVGTVSITLCSVSLSSFAVVSDNLIKLTVSDPGLTASKSCDIVVTNPIGKSSTSSNDAFNYVPHSQSGGTTHAPSVPANPSKIFYITVAGIAAVALFAVAGLMRRWDPGRREQATPRP